MIELNKIISAAALFVIASGGIASAQTSAKPLKMAQTKPAASQAASVWSCPFAIVELSPVSHDTAGRPSEWVMVHRVNGEIVAAERVSADDAAQIRAMPCGGHQTTQPPLVG